MTGKKKSRKDLNTAKPPRIVVVKELAETKPFTQQTEVDAMEASRGTREDKRAQCRASERNAAQASTAADITRLSRLSAMAEAQDDFCGLRRMDAMYSEARTAYAGKMAHIFPQI